MEDEAVFRLNSIYKRFNCTDDQGRSLFIKKLFDSNDQTSRNPYMIKKLISEPSLDSNKIKEVYDQLENRNVKELQCFVLFLTHIRSDPKIKEMLKKDYQDSQEKSRISQAYQSRFVHRKPETSEILHRTNGYMKNSKYIGLDFVETAAIPEFSHANASLNSFNSYEEDVCVTKDLISLLMNNYGLYIRPIKNSSDIVSFTVHETMSISNKGITEQVLKICTNASIIAKFVDDYSDKSCGTINQALAAALGAQLRQFRLEICRAQAAALMPPPNTLTPSQLLSYLCQGPEPVLRTLADLCTTIRKSNIKGGTLLTTFCRKLASNGSPKDKALYSHLMQCITVPFFRMLRLWIYRGIISDPYKEFFICEDDKYNLRNDDRHIAPEYWNKRYIKQSQLVPKFLESHEDKILNTGKYLNVIQMTGGDANFATIEEMVYEVEERHYEVQIARAYKHASQLLMDILKDKKRLLDHFKFMKHYFLLNQADWLSHFMYLASNEFSQKAEEVDLSRLESLLDVAVQAGSNLNENLRDYLKVDLSKEDIMILIKIVSFNPDGNSPSSVSSLKHDAEQKRILSKRVESNTMQAQSSTPSKEINKPSGKKLTVMEAFCLSASFEWPISLIFDSNTMIHYQILFRHLFYCHHVERVLSVIWLTNKCSNINRYSNSHIVNKANVLGGRMRNFVQNLLYFMTIEVIEPGWIQLEHKINQAGDIDCVFKAHSDFLNYCFLNCMLTEKTHLSNLHKILAMCVLFSNKFNKLLDNTYLVLDGSMNGADNSINIDNYEQEISKNDQDFTYHINNMINDIRKDPKRPKNLNNFLMRLEFNNFYDGSINSAHRSSVGQ